MPNLQNHTTSYELSKELHDLCEEKGIVLPESNFHWWRYSDGSYELIHETKYEDKEWAKENKFPAYISSELGEIVKGRIKSSNRNVSFGFMDDSSPWAECRYDSHNEEYITADTEANARCKMLIYLIKNNLIEL